MPGGSYFGTGHITVRFPSPWVMPQELGGRIVATATEDYRHWHLDGSLASMRVATRLPQNTLSCHVKVAMHSIRHRYQIKQIGVTNVLIFKSRYRLFFFFWNYIYMKGLLHTILFSYLRGMTTVLTNFRWAWNKLMHLSLCHRTVDAITEIPSDSDCANDIETDTRHIHVRESGTFHNMECTHVHILSH